MGIVLACAWRPRGELTRWRRARPALDSTYSQIVVAVPPDSDPAQVGAMAEATGGRVLVAPRPYWARHTALQEALAFLAQDETARNGGAEHIHYADGDRLLHWVETRPGEWQAAVGAIQEVDCLVLGRTDHAFRSHPENMQQTESIINAVGSHLLGMTVDLGGGSRGLSRRAAELAVALCPPEQYGDAAWPILAHRAGLRVAYRAVDGLEWETPDHHKEKAETDLAARRKRARQSDADPERWRSRTRTALEIVKEALTATTQSLP